VSAACPSLRTVHRSATGVRVRVSYLILFAVRPSEPHSTPLKAETAVCDRFVFGLGVACAPFPTHNSGPYATRQDMRASQSQLSFASSTGSQRRHLGHSSSLAGHFRGGAIPQTTNPQQRRPQSAAMSGTGRSFPVTGYPTIADSLARSSQLARSQSQASGIVRAGGRLFAHSPIAGFTKEEMLHEAKVRQEHNRQRSKLKQLLQASAGPGNTVSVEDLMLSAKIAKMSLPDALLFKSPYANRYTASRTENGDPKDIRWQSFHSSISYPKLSNEADRIMRRSLRPQSAAPVVQEAAAARPETPEEDLGPWDSRFNMAAALCATAPHWPARLPYQGSRVAPTYPGEQLRPPRSLKERGPDSEQPRDGLVRISRSSPAHLPLISRSSPAHLPLISHASPAHLPRGITQVGRGDPACREDRQEPHGDPLHADPQGIPHHGRGQDRHRIS
jgi:hypothetical protein